MLVRRVAARHALLPPEGHLGFGPIQSFVTLQLPLAYLLKQSTSLSDNQGELFEHSQRNMWQVQEPVTLRLMVVYALGAKPMHSHAEN